MDRNGAVVGLISDTHGLLRPEALRALDGSDLIVHAGDVGKPEILDALKLLAPVVAVRGNIDRGGWATALPMTTTVAVGLAAVYILHNLQQLDLDPAAAGFHVVVSGTPTSLPARNVAASFTSIRAVPDLAASSCR